MPESTAEEIPTLGTTVTVSRFQFVAFADMTVRQHASVEAAGFEGASQTECAIPPERNTAICLVLR